MEVAHRSSVWVLPDGSYHIYPFLDEGAVARRIDRNRTVCSQAIEQDCIYYDYRLKPK